MRVSFLSSSIFPNAAGVYEVCRHLAGALNAREDLSVSIVGGRGMFSSGLVSDWGATRATPVNVIGPWVFGFAPRMYRALVAQRPEVVHVHGLWQYPSLVCLQWANRRQKPYVVSPHGMLDRWALNNASFRKRLAAWLFQNQHLKRSSCIHVLSHAEALSLRQYGMENPLCYIPNGVEIPISIQNEKPPWTDTETCGRVLLFLGRLHKKKGLLELLAGFERCQRMTPAAKEWTLAIAGWDDGGHEQVARRAADELGLEAPKVLWLGPLYGHAKQAAFAAAEGFILPSHSEGLPTTVLEAWANELPVVMTKECNLPEGFQSEAAIQVVADAAGVGAGLHSLFEMDQKARYEMGQRGRRLVESRFTWSRVSERHAATYRWILGGGQPPEWVL